MQRKHTGGYSERRERAAFALAEDRTTREQIAAAVGINDATLWRWERQPEFAARVAEHKATLAAAVVAQGIANKQRRVAALQDAFDRMEQVIAARATDPSMQDVPGGKTGLLVRQIKALPGRASRAGMVEEYAVDGGTLAERRATLKQAAQEMGDWTEKREVAGPGGGPQVVQVVYDDDASPGAADGTPAAASRGTADDYQGGAEV